jgi:non-homologous end joining protein Ku
MPKASPSTRSSGEVNLSFGVINIPTTLYSGTVSDHGIKRNEFVPFEGEDDHPVGRGAIDKATGELLPPGTEVVKKIQTEYGPVYVEDAEIERLFSLNPNSLVVKEFEPQHNFHAGHFVPQGLMFLEPRKVGSGRKKGPDPIATKILATLLKAMKANNAMAVCELTTRGKPKPAILMPDGRLWLVYHTDATREQRELPAAEVNDAEVEMMGTLLKAMWQDQPLDFTDERSALIQGFADEKAAAGDFGKPEVSDAPAAAAPAATPDLMAMLAASVEAAKAAS